MNAGKATVTVRKGASTFDSATSFVLRELAPGVSESYVRQRTELISGSI